MDLHGEITDDEDFLELVDIVQHPRRQRVIRERNNHFQQWSDEEFRNRFRLSKPVVAHITELIQHTIASRTNRNHALTPEEMVLITLRYMAAGSMLIVIGDFCGIDKSTVSRVLDKVINAIAQLCGTYIKMPNNEDYEEVIQGFYNISRFPRCIGAIDCTHIKIQSPGGAEAETYRNRKGYFSFNVQVICDSTLKIRNIVCRWPGSAHDAHIFRNSRIKAQLEDGQFNDKLIIGDSGYGVKPYLMTPIGNPQTPAQRLYNEALVRTRNTIERCFGVWKRRFPVLSVGLRLNVEKIEGIVVAAAVLHNIACDMRDEQPAIDADFDVVANNVEIPEVPDQYGNEAVRTALVHEYFQNLLNDHN